MALFQASQFSGVTRPTPRGGGSLANGTDPVTLRLRSGVVTTVFDTKATALACLERMRSTNQVQQEPVPNVLVLNVDGTKLVLAEKSPEIAKLLQSFVFEYAGGVLVLRHRALPRVLSLNAALAEVAVNVAVQLKDNAAFLATVASPPYVPMQVVDWNYRAAAASGSGSQLRDATPLEYDYTV